MQTLTAYICGSLITGVLAVKDVESDGTHVHLIETKGMPSSVCEDGRLPLTTPHAPVYISYNSPEPLGKEGDIVKVYVHAECQSMRGVDEKLSDKFNRWVSYRSWKCDASEVTLAE